MLDTLNNWGQAPSGAPISQFTLSNDRLRIAVTDIGASLVRVDVPDRRGLFGNVTVSGPSADDYVMNPSYLGAIVGRFANRIDKGEFWLEGKHYQLARNHGTNHLHGGLRGFSHALWQAESAQDRITLRYVSPDGEEGYPGTLTTTVTYRLENADLVIEYSARCDAPTVVNLTNHAYWNLSGSGTILNHELEMWSDDYLEVDANILPTGRILNVGNSPFEFRRPFPIGTSINQLNGGYDHCFLVRNWDSTLRLAARVIDPASGRGMEVHTTEPGIQLYTANHFSGGPDSAGFGQHEAFCLECQHFPDSPNQPEFPSTAIRPGEEYRQVTVYRFFNC